MYIAYKEIQPTDSQWMHHKCKRKHICLSTQTMPTHMHAKHMCGKPMYDSVTANGKLTLHNLSNRQHDLKQLSVIMFQNYITLGSRITLP